MPNTNFQTFHQMGAAINEFVKQATGRDNVQNIDIDHVTVAQNHYYEDVDISGIIASFIANHVAPLVSCVVNIEPIQSGSGDPAPDNVRSITGWTGANISRTGINVWDEQWEIGIYSPSDGTKITSPGYFRCKNKIPILPNTSYYIGSNVNATWRILFYGADKNFLSTTLITNSVFTTPKDCYWLTFCGATTFYGTTYNNDIRINYPATDTDYHPGHAQTYDIEFPSEAGTVYSGTLDLTTGTLVVTHKMFEDSGSGWTKNANGSFYKWIAGIGGIILTNSHDGLSNYGQYIYSNTGAGIYANGNNGTLNIGSDANMFETVEELQTAFSSVPLQVLAPLAEPQTYQLTPIEIQTIIGQNNIWADTGNVEVKFTDIKELY